MSWLLSIAVALLTGVAGLVAAGFVAERYAAWHHVSSFEGASGYLVVGVALLGGLGGVVLGLVVARIVAGTPRAGFLRALGASLGVTAAIALASLGLAWLRGDQAPTLDGDELALLVELRMPDGWAPAPGFTEGRGGTWLSSLRAGGTLGHTGYGELLWDDIGVRDGRWVIPTRTRVFTTTGRRLLRVNLGDSARVDVVVPLPGRPGRDLLAWSDWRTDGFARDSAGRPLHAGHAYRFRVEPWGARQARRDSALAKEQAAVQAAFDRLGPGTPAAAWLDWVGDYKVQARRDSALAALSRRLDDFPALLRDPDPVRVRLALEAASMAPPLPDSARPALLEGGRTLARALAALPPTDTLAGTLYVGASYWINAWCRQWPGDTAARATVEAFGKAAEGKTDEYWFASLEALAKERTRTCC
jgi:hypothetical protein